MNVLELILKELINMGDPEDDTPLNMESDTQASVSTWLSTK